MNQAVPEGIQKIKPVADANLQLTYNYSKALSLFASMYNIADRSYLIWNNYPSQRFNMMFGLSYKL
jgi:outer membrane receptor protein involved in Fe transport